jgi:protein TonB
MMIKTAGGPGLVSPIDFHERRTPRFTRTTWIATGIVVAAHIGAGAALYYQRFELRIAETPPAPPPFTITLDRPEVKPVEPRTTPVPPRAPNTVFNETPAPPINVETIHVIQGETTADHSTTITLATPVPKPVDNAVATEPVRQPPSVIRNPSWAQQPSADQLMRAYPGPRDHGRDIGFGLAQLSCPPQRRGHRLQRHAGNPRRLRLRARGAGALASLPGQSAHRRRRGRGLSGGDQSALQRAGGLIRRP